MRVRWRTWLGLRCLLSWCPFRPNEHGQVGVHCAFGCGRQWFMEP